MELQRNGQQIQQEQRQILLQQHEGDVVGRKSGLLPRFETCVVATETGVYGNKKKQQPQQQQQQDVESSSSSRFSANEAKLSSRNRNSQGNHNVQNGQQTQPQKQQPKRKQSSSSSSQLHKDYNKTAASKASSQSSLLSSPPTRPLSSSSCTSSSSLTTTTTTSRPLNCATSKKCVNMCEAYGLVCPWAAQVAARTTTRTLTELLRNSQVFETSTPPTFRQVKPEEIRLGEKLGEGGFSIVSKCTLISTRTKATATASDTLSSTHLASDHHHNSNNNHHHHHDISEEETIMQQNRQQSGQEQQQKEYALHIHYEKKDLAIKYLRRRAMIDPHHFKHGAADLAVEAYFLQTLNHPNIIQLHGIAAGSIQDNILSRNCGVGGCFLLLDRLVESLEQRIEGWKRAAAANNNSNNNSTNNTNATAQRLQTLQATTGGGGNGGTPTTTTSSLSCSTNVANTAGTTSAATTILLKPQQFFQSLVGVVADKWTANRVGGSGGGGRNLTNNIHNTPTTTTTTNTASSATGATTSQTMLSLSSSSSGFRFTTTARRELKQSKRLQLLERLQIALEISKAMKYLHSLNVMFRDLKPSNIGFNQRGTLKLFDFGLAKELKGPRGTYRLTGHTGSRRYMVRILYMYMSYDKNSVPLVSCLFLAKTKDDAARERRGPIMWILTTKSVFLKYIVRTCRLPKLPRVPVIMI